MWEFFPVVQYPWSAKGTLSYRRIWEVEPRDGTIVSWWIKTRSLGRNWWLKLSKGSKRRALWAPLMSLNSSSKRGVSKSLSKVNFEELKIALWRENPTLDANFFMQSLDLRGREIKTLVMSQRPKSLKEAYAVAAHQELVWELLNKKTRMASKPFQNSTPVLLAKPATKNNAYQNKNNSQAKPITSQKSNNCYWCKEPWFPGHQCKTRTLNLFTIG